MAADFSPAFDPTFLQPNEQDLLLNALNSNKPGASATMNPLTTPAKQRSNTLGSQSHGTPDLYTSPLDQTPASGFEPTPALGNFETPFIDYDLDETNFDWDVNGQLIGDLPGGPLSAGASLDKDEPGDKRKHPTEDDGAGKRRTSEDKPSNKKPGRKPLTSEPTSKRKAQNRAAQRAFRERKEQHLRTLEQKVEDLERASESANHENGLLRAQVERLNTELREYRKRLSVTNTNRYSPPGQSSSLSNRSQWDVNNNFQFAFPRFGPFGSDPNAPPFLNQSIPSPTTVTDPSTQNASTAPNLSPTGMDELRDLFSPSILASVSSNSDLDYLNSNLNTGQSPASVQSKVSERANSEANTGSPASSATNGAQSSSVTTPEYTAESPEQRKAGEAALGTVASGQPRKGSITHDTFCKEFSKACGNKQNPVPRSLSEADTTPASTGSGAMPPTPLPEPGFDWFATQNGGAFDPVLFGDYREPQENIMSGDLGGFFQDAYDMPGLGDHTTPLEAHLPKKQDLMKQIEAQQEGKEAEVVPGEHPKQFLTCNMLWDRVQRSQKVQDGAEMDDLCLQLKAKAKCSGQGAVIDQRDVDAILGPPPADTKDFFKMFK